MSPQVSSPRPNLVESDSGFSVEVLGMTGMRYTEGGRVMKIDSEVLAGTAGIALFTKSIKGWEPPHEADALTDADKRQIIANIQLAFQSQGWGLDVVTPPLPAAHFSSPRPNLFVSDRGFAVEVLGPTSVRYTKGDWAVTIPLEASEVRGEKQIRTSSIQRWESPHEADTLNNIDRARICKSLRLAFQAQGWGFAARWDTFRETPPMPPNGEVADGQL
jgi:hypothetical protein